MTAATTEQPHPPAHTDPFDPQMFRETSRLAVDRLARQLADRSVRGLDLTDPALLTDAARALMTGSDDRVAAFDQDRLESIIDLYVRTGIQVHSPGAMGRQFTGPVPLSGVIDFVGSMVAQPASFYEAGQLPNVAERIMAEELNRFIGWEPGRFAMVTTSGGSLANLTALLAARTRAFGDGDLTGAAIAVGQNAHYSVDRAAGVMGLPESRIIRLPVDRAQRIRPDAARAALVAARRRGLRVFALVASAGSTSVGAFDPLPELAALAHEHGLWLHVDGAHGASLLVSDRLRDRLRGIEQADSLTWDAHKMMFVPAPCTMLFYRDGEHGAGAFPQRTRHARASYVFDEEPDRYAAFDGAERNFECTKRPMIMTLWALWAMYGRALFADRIEYLCDLTRQAHQIVAATPDFETVHRPEANILCFRYRPAGVYGRDTHRLQLALRDRLRGGGRFFVSKVDVDGFAALRVVLMNHLTTAEHFRALLAEIATLGEELR